MNHNLKKSLSNFMYGYTKSISNDIKNVKQDLYQKTKSIIKEQEKLYTNRVNQALKEIAVNVINEDFEVEDEETPTSDDEEEAAVAETEPELEQQLVLDLSSDFGILFNQVIENDEFPSKKDFEIIKKEFQNDEPNLSSLSPEGLAFAAVIDDATLDLIQKYKVKLNIKEAFNFDQKKEYKVEDEEELEDDLNNPYKSYGFDFDELIKQSRSEENNTSEPDSDWDNHENYQDSPTDISKYKTYFYEVAGEAESKVLDLIYDGDTDTIKKYAISMILGLLSGFKFDSLNIEDKQSIVQTVEKKLKSRVLTVMRAMEDVLIRDTYENDT